MSVLMVVGKDDKDTANAEAEKICPGIGDVFQVPLSATGKYPATHYWMGISEHATAVRAAIKKLKLPSFRSFLWNTNKDIRLAQKKLKSLNLKRIEDG